MKLVFVAVLSSVLGVVIGMVGPGVVAGGALPGGGSSTTLCETNTAVSEKGFDCPVGARIAFTPRMFGNEQLPIVFAAQWCDPNREMVLTNGGVYCTYLPRETYQEAPPLS